MVASSPLLVTVNGGSSSIKFALFTSEVEPHRIMGGEIPIEGDAVPHRQAARLVLDALEPHLVNRTLAGIVHRLVHGATRFYRPALITPDARTELTQLIPLAPNHLPSELALIDAFADARPHIPQIACFDTAFHHDLPDLSRTLPVPPSTGLRKYGFHGLSYAFLLSELENVAGTAAARGRVILAHLGNGASLAAVSHGRSVDTTMGLTPAGGLVMSSRPGDLDPGVVTYLARTGRLSIEELDDVLTQQSGLLAISGRSANMRELLAHEDADPRARLAVDLFCYQLRKWIGAFAAALGGVDTLVFSGGIGEHSPEIRARTCEALGFLGLHLDPATNSRNAAIISTPESRACVRVIPTNEELMMAREARAILAAPLDQTAP